MCRLAILIVLVFASAHSRAAEFEVFTLSQIESSNPDVKVYVLNEGDRMLADINKRLYDSGIVTEAQAKKLIPQELTLALSRQVQGLTRAARYQLRYFPAIVFDGRYVIYGTTDIATYDRVRP